MRILLCITLLLTVQSISGQWIKQNVDTTASLRGLSVVNENVVWASGTGGTVIRTVDGGKTWKTTTVSAARIIDKLDLRDIEAFGADTAYVLGIGGGRLSQIHKTTDGGVTWKVQFVNNDVTAFYDAIACWDENNCIAMSDPVNNKYVLIATSDGGATWRHIDTAKMPAATFGEAAFAASGTCLITHGKDGVFLVTGGGNARVFYSGDRGQTWTVTDTAMVKGQPGTGIFSIAMFDAMNGVIVGGDYQKPAEARNNLLLTTDGGKTWKLGTGLGGYRSGVTYVDRKTIVAVGTSGSDISRDGGRTWKPLGKQELNSVQARGPRAVWAVGPSGLVVKLQ
jgi:photosystem II stability/assembly factor-like uncharacterized protein